MSDNIFSNLVSITKGLHRDKKSEREFKILLGDLKLKPVAENAIFDLQFKKPLNCKKEYYQINIFNNTQDAIAKFQDDFPQDATTAENKYSYIVLSNKFEKYLNDIAKYINDRNITHDLADDSNYIINYLKASAIKLYAELQSQYGQYSDAHLYTIPELAEKYFNEIELDNNITLKEKVVKQNIDQRPKETKKPTPKISFGYLKQDPNWLLQILKKLQFGIDLLDSRTEVKDLHELLLSNDFRDFKTKIYLDCKTTEFKYVINLLQNNFKNLNPKVIESTGLFYTKLGKPLSAQNIYSKSKSPLKKTNIDIIFKQMQ